MQRRHILAGFLATPALLRHRSVEAAAPVPPGYRVTWFDAANPGGGRVGARDITAAGDGTFWFCGQRDGTLNRLDPQTGAIRRVLLGQGAAPHGVVRGPDGAAWVTEGGQNAIARVDPADHRVRLWRLPERFRDANLNTGVFDAAGTYWFTGQNGVVGRLDPRTERMDVREAPGGPGAYGITRTPSGGLWYVSLAGNHLAEIEGGDLARIRVVAPPTPGQGARRVWSDSLGRLWISEWNSGNVSMHDPRDASWRVWRLPGQRPRCYAVWVDPSDKVWVTDFGANAVLRFDPADESFLAFPSDRANANVRQLDGVAGAAWGGESGTDRILRVEYGL